MLRRRISGVDTEVLHVLRPTLRPGHDFVEIKADLPADAAVWHSQRLAHPKVREDDELLPHRWQPSLDVNISPIMKKLSLLDRVCPKAAELLRE